MERGDGGEVGMGGRESKGEERGEGRDVERGGCISQHIPHTYILLLCEVIDLVAVPEHSNVFCSLTQSHHDWAASHHLPCSPGRAYMLV